MADGEHERIAIASFTRPQKTYGTTNRYQKRQEYVVKHHVKKSDTLQGIALKYGVTMEQIRRVNKLWANDSLFLREHLLIPVSSDAVGHTVAPEDVEVHLATPSSGENSPNGHWSESEKDASGEQEDNAHNRDRSDQSLSDYFVQIDSAIAQTRKKVQNMEQQRSNGPAEGCSFLEHSQHCRGETSLRGGGDSLASHTTVMTHGRRVQTSLRKHEKRQEEIFEL